MTPAYAYVLAAAYYADTCRRLAAASVAVAQAHTTQTERAPVIVACAEYLEAHRENEVARREMEEAYGAWLLDAAKSVPR